MNFSPTLAASAANPSSAATRAIALSAQHLVTKNGELAPLDTPLVQSSAVEQDAVHGARPDLAAAQTGAVLALTGIVIAPLVALMVRRIFPGRNVMFARWGFSHVVLVVVMIFFVGALTRELGPTGDGHILVDLARSAIAFGSGAALVAWFAYRLDPEGLRCLGLWPGRHVRALLAGLAAYVAFAPAIVGVGFLSAWLVEVLHLGTGKQEIAVELAKVAPSERWIAVVLGTLVVPLFEEILFRVFLQPLFVQNFRERAGIALTSLVFAALHGADAFLPIFVLSLLLGSVMLRTQRLVAVWGIHALHNGMMFVAMYGALDSTNGARAMLGRLF